MNLDTSTLIRGTDGPFDYWESDHTALVHVLWAAKRAGLSIDDADAVAEMIMRSRWAAAFRANTPVLPATHLEEE